MRIRSSLTATLLTLCLLGAAAARQQSPQQQPQGDPARRSSSPQLPADEDDVVRITTNLVQLDVTVTDKNGRPVPDLRAEDFQLYEDGKEREITNFSYVSTEPETDGPSGESVASASAASKEKRSKDVPPPPSAPLQRREVRRTIALIVDNLKMAPLSTLSSREGLRKFVDEQMRPGDLVGIYTTRGGSGALQQFTSDKAQLHRAIDRVRWYPPPLGGLGTDIFEAARNDETVKRVGPGSGGEERMDGVGIGKQTFEDDSTREARERGESRNRDLVAYGTLGTLRYIIRGMQEAPGRKSAVLFSDGIPLFTTGGDLTRARDIITQVIDSANRAGVVIYTVDSRGVFVPNMISAIDDVPPDKTDSLREMRLRESRLADGGSSLLANETGGLFIRNVNDMDLALKRVMRDQSGFYLLGYRPTEQTFKGGADEFRKISVKVKRSGLNVRSRKGFIAVTDEAVRREARGSDRELYTVLASPVNAGGLYIRLTARVIGDARDGAAARLLLHLDGKDLTFTDEPNGYRKLVLDVAAVTLGRDGQIIDEFNRTHTVRTGGEHLDNIVSNGLTYMADVPVKKPGVYQLRIVVRDQGSQRMGSASQLIEVPDLKQQRLTLSGLSLRAAAADGGQMTAEPARASAETAISPVNDPSDPAVRRFRPGAVLVYNYQVYNAATDASSGRARLTEQVRLFRNGAEVLSGDAGPLEIDPARGWAEGGMRLAPDAKPGEYVLQIIVTDPSAKDKNARQASQWIDFEVVQ